MVIHIVFLPPLLVCKHLGINQGDKEQLGREVGGNETLGEMVAELRAEGWELLVDAPTFCRTAS